MLKPLKAFFSGILVIALGIFWLAQPGMQGTGGSIALILVGLFLILRGIRLLMGAGTMQSARSSTSGLGDPGSSRANVFSGRRVILPGDSRPELPFKL